MEEQPAKSVSASSSSITTIDDGSNQSGDIGCECQLSRGVKSQFGDDVERFEIWLDRLLRREHTCVETFGEVVDEAQRQTEEWVKRSINRAHNRLRLYEHAQTSTEIVFAYRRTRDAQSDGTQDWIGSRDDNLELLEQQALNAMKALRNALQSVQEEGFARDRHSPSLAFS